VIVCSCHAVSDRALRELAAGGLAHDEVIAATGAGTDCGHCQGTVAAILLESRPPCGCSKNCGDCSNRARA
jgi:bacterioferritin-associated ferredoxin